LGILNVLSDISERIEKEITIASASDDLWGVDSFDPADIKVPNENITLFEYVVKHEKRRPAFFGRYIAQPTKSAVVTDSEAKFIHGLDCKILPFYANLNDAQVSVSGAKGVEKGKAHAKAALSAARGLKIPTGVYIYCNIEPHWHPTLDFMLGWWETFANSEYLGGGGFYCGPSAFPVFQDAVDEAKNRFSVGTSLLQPVLWVTKSSGGKPPSGFNGPKPPSLPHLVRGWQYSFLHGPKNFQYDKNVTISRGIETMW
jgi:hypothetical protein